jgi:hypothetical protein
MMWRFLLALMVVAVATVSAFRSPVSTPRMRKTELSMGGKMSKFGIFSPAVYAAKAVLGEAKLNKLRGKAISLHSQAITEWCQQFVSQRSGKADVASCVFTVFTTGAVLKVTSPAQTGVWGAVRTLSLELGLDGVHVRVPLDQVRRRHALGGRSDALGLGLLLTRRRCLRGLDDLA